METNISRLEINSEELAKRFSGAMGNKPELCSRIRKCDSIYDLEKENYSLAGFYTRLVCELHPEVCELNLPLKS